MHNAIKKLIPLLFALSTIAICNGHDAFADEVAPIQPAPPAPSTPAPIRFLLTFDDGPSAKENDNPTEKILEFLQNNPVQPGIKAIFFAQTRAVNGGGTDRGRALLKQEVELGHLLAFHTATPRHTNHRSLSADALNASLALGIADLNSISGTAPTLVRPPMWSYDKRTLESYHSVGLNMLLTDLSANDGVIYFFKYSLTKRSNMRKMLAAIRPAWESKAMPEVDGVTPIVVTFHDVNTYTASVMEDYINILLDVAKEVDMPVAQPAFYDNRQALEKAALARTISDATTQQNLPGWWNLIWKFNPFY